MNHLDYLLFLDERDQHCKLSGNDYKVYHKLVHIAKSAGWPTTFARSDASLQKVCNIQENTIRGCRDRLEAAGLIATTQTGKGRNAATVYRLLNASKIEVFNQDNTSKIEALATGNTSKNEVINGVNTAKIEVLPELNASKIDVLTLDNKEGSSTASAATPPDASIIENEEGNQPTASPKKPTDGKRKSAKASPEEIAALALPHLGQEFTDLWIGFVAGPKQQGKSLFAFRLLLKTLGKYDEGFAIIMLQKAIESNWSGVEYDSTPAAYAKWQTEQARLSAQVASSNTTPIDRDALFGFQQSASDGLAQARNTPEYLEYLAQQQAQVMVTT
ncbi:MAG: hypothetical protein ACRYFV_13780 [Janthinobacterium lividum]